MEHKPQYMKDNSWRRSPFKYKEYGNGYTDLPTIFDSTEWPVTDTRVIPRVKTKKQKNLFMKYTLTLEKSYWIAFI